MGRKNRRGQGEGSPRRGMRRSIRHDAEEETDDFFDDPDKSLIPPEALHLRRLPAEEALFRLSDTVRRLKGTGAGELLVVHGRGHNSPGGKSVLGPLVRAWCEDNPQLVSGWREAPPRWGGPGAIVLTLR